MAIVAVIVIVIFIAVDVVFGTIAAPTVAVLVPLITAVAMAVL